MKIELFKEPKNIKLKDLFKNRNIYYVRRFEYGDFDNWVNAVITAMDVSLNYTSYFEKSEGIFEEGDCSVCLKQTFIPLSIAATNGLSDAHKSESFSCDLIKTKLMKDLFNYEISVIGTYKE